MVVVPRATGLDHHGRAEARHVQESRLVEVFARLPHPFLLRRLRLLRFGSFDILTPRNRVRASLRESPFFRILPPATAPKNRACAFDFAFGISHHHFEPEPSPVSHSQLGHRHLHLRSSYRSYNTFPSSRQPGSSHTDDTSTLV